MSKHKKPAEPPPIYTAAEAAACLGCHRDTVLRHVRRLGLGRRIGQAVVLSPGEVEQLRGEVRPAKGNPNFVQGNRFGQPPK